MIWCRFLLLFLLLFLMSVSLSLSLSLGKNGWDRTQRIWSLRDQNTQPGILGGLCLEAGGF